MRNASNMFNYSFDTIIINNREVRLDRIINNNERAVTNFEASAFLFIRQWFHQTTTFMQQTSGSTGVPKQIAVTREQMVASALLTKQALMLNAGETSFVCLDPAYIAGKMMLVRSFVVDMKIVMAEPRLNPFQGLSENELDFTALVPLQLAELLQSDDKRRLNSFKSILIGGAAISPEIQKSTSKLTSRIYATYGMTETVSHIALQRINGRDASEYFTVLPGIEIYSDDRGCLVIHSPYLDEKIVTNDMVEIIDERHFKWLGRADNVINTGGVKMIPEKIELLIHKVFDNLGIKNKFFISSIKDVALGDRLILLIEGELDTTSIRAIKSSLKKNLHPYENPKEVFTNVNFVLTETGKVNRQETRRRADF
jgi:O-succinylbenzoic acid--CoA ligase